MNGYERFRESLRGTVLEGAAEKIKAAYDLRDDDPAWTYVATVEVASYALMEKIGKAEALLTDLPEALRAAAVPIVEGLAQDTVGAVREDAKTALIDLLGKALDIHEREVATLVRSQEAAAKTLTTAAQSAVADINERAMTTGSVLTTSAARLAGWTTVRISYVAFGVILGAALLAVGFFGRIGGDLRECNVKVERLAIASHYTAHEQNLLRHAACDL